MVHSNYFETKMTEKSLAHIYQIDTYSQIMRFDRDRFQSRNEAKSLCAFWKSQGLYYINKGTEEFKNTFNLSGIQLRVFMCDLL
jgi:hypothetical protein